MVISFDPSNRPQPIAVPPLLARAPYGVRSDDEVRLTTPEEACGAYPTDPLVGGLREAYSSDAMAAAYVDGSIPVDGPDFEQDAQELVDDDNPGALDSTTRGLADCTAVVEALEGDRILNTDLSDLGPGANEAVYQANALQETIKDAATATGQARILSASVSRGHVTTVRRHNFPTRLSAEEVQSGVFSTACVRRSCSAPAVFHRVVRRPAAVRITAKVDEANAMAAQASMQAGALGRVLRGLGGAIGLGSSDKIAFWRVSKLGGERRLKDLGNRVQIETTDLIGQMLKGMPSTSWTGRRR